MRKALLLTPVILSAVIGACSSSSTPSTPAVACGPDNVATTAWDVAAINAYEASFYYATFDPIPVGPFVAVASLTPEQAPAADAGAGDAGAPTATSDASAVAAAVGKYFPNSCASATASGNVVTFTLNDCSGPLGLTGATGTVTATLTTATNGVHAELSGSNIAVNGGTIDLSTSGTATAATDGQKTLTANTQSSGTGPDGNSATHMGMYTLVWPTGTGCATINGSFSGIGSGTYGGTTSRSPTS